MGDLKSWLGKMKLSHHENGLNEYEISSVEDLKILYESDLQNIVAVLNFTLSEKTRFLVAVRKLQNKHVAPRIEVDVEGQKDIKKLNSVTVEARQTLSTIETRMQDVNENMKTSKKAVSVEFLELRKKLEAREHELITEIEQKGTEKIAKLQQQSTSLRNALASLSEVKSKVERMLLIKDLDKFDEQQESVKNELKKVRAIDFPRHPATNADLRFRSDPSLGNRVVGHGDIVEYGVIQPPSITKLEETASSIQVFWEHKCEPGTPVDALPIGFGIKSIENGQENLETEFEVDSKAENFEIKDLKMNMKYEIMMRTKNRNGWSVFGDTASVTTKKGIQEFPGSSLLDTTSTQQIIEFLGGAVKNANLLFKASVHGFTTNEFHKRCDNKGPTLIVAKRTGSPIIYGGYTPISWKSNGKWQRDDTLSSFVFTMSNDDGVPGKYKHKTSPGYAIYCHKSHGVYIGGGGVLRLIYNSSKSEGNGTYQNSDFGIPSPTTLCGIISNKMFAIDDFEVFSVTL